MLLLDLSGSDGVSFFSIFYLWRDWRYDSLDICFCLKMECEGKAERTSVRIYPLFLLRIFRGMCSLLNLNHWIADS